MAPTNINKNRGLCRHFPDTVVKTLPLSLKKLRKIGDASMTQTKKQFMEYNINDFLFIGKPFTYKCFNKILDYTIYILLNLDIYIYRRLMLLLCCFFFLPPKRTQWAYNHHTKVKCIVGKASRVLPFFVCLLQFWVKTSRQSREVKKAE